MVFVPSVTFNFKKFLYFLNGKIFFNFFLDSPPPVYEISFK